MKSVFLVPFGLAVSLVAQPTFAPVATFDSGGIVAMSIAVGDVNGDGNPDLVIANECAMDTCMHGSVGVALGNGDGSFQPLLTYASGGYLAYSVAMGDLNGDGKIDLLVAHNCPPPSSCPEGYVSVLRGNGDGTFSPGGGYTSGGPVAMSIALDDINGDGKLDSTVANTWTNLQDSRGSVGVLLGNGDGTFQSAQTYFSGGHNARAIAVGDINGDGKPDLISTNECNDSSCSGSAVGVLLGNGDGTFQGAQAYGSGENHAEGLAVGDLNGDGELDLLVKHAGSVGVLLGNGDGSLQSPVIYPSGTSNSSIALGDLNLDGKPDVTVTYGLAVGVLLGNGDGTLQTLRTYESGGDSHSIAVADVNGDDKPDVLIANFCADINNCGTVAGTVGVLINTTPWPYKAFVQQPINSDGSSIFKASRGVIPVKFVLTQHDTPTCTLPMATIAVSRTADGTIEAMDESAYSMAADNGSIFKIDQTSCQYVYNLAAAPLGVGTYLVKISIDGTVGGQAVFALE